MATKAMDLRALQMQLDKGKLDNIYFVYGEESYLVDESVLLIKDKFLTEGGAIDFNYDQYYATETKASQVREAVETLPMMCPRRLVVLKQAQNYKENDWNLLLPLFEEPISSCVFLVVSDKADKRKKYFKALQKNASIIELKKPYDNQMPSWVHYIAQNNELKLTSQQVAYIQQVVGTSLSDINNELKKLKQFLGDKLEATNQEISQVVSKSRVDSIFDLTDAVGIKDRSRALQSLENLFEQGQSEVGAVQLIARHLRILASVKREQARKSSIQQMQSSIGVPQFFLKRYIQQTSMWTEERLSDSFHKLQHTDKMLKSSPVDSKYWLEDFVVVSCR